jgi:hypothetical protein
MQQNATSENAIPDTEWDLRSRWNPPKILWYGSFNTYVKVFLNKHIR